MITLTISQINALRDEMHEVGAIDARVEEITNSVAGTIQATLIATGHVEVRHILVGAGGSVVRSAER